MVRLYLNGRLCNGTGRGKDEYTLPELKQIAKDNNVFIFSTSTKEDICKELIKHNKASKKPIIINPTIANTPKPVSVAPVVVTSATKVPSATKVTSATKVPSATKATKASSSKKSSTQLETLEKEVEKAKRVAEDAEAIYLGTLDRIQILLAKKDEVLWAEVADRRKKEEVLAMAEKIDENIEKMTRKSEKAKDKYYDAAQIAIEKMKALEEFKASIVTKYSKVVTPSPVKSKAAAPEEKAEKFKVRLLVTIYNVDTGAELTPKKLAKEINKWINKQLETGGIYAHYAKCLKSDVKISSPAGYSSNMLQATYSYVIDGSCGYLSGEDYGESMLDYVGTSAVGNSRAIVIDGNNSWRINIDSIRDYDKPIPKPKKNKAAPKPKASPKDTKETKNSPKPKETKAAPKPKETKNECVKLNGKKYAERPSPPYPANECRDKIILGNDGKQYISSPTKTGIYRWVLVG